MLALLRSKPASEQASVCKLPPLSNDREGCGERLAPEEAGRSCSEMSSPRASSLYRLDGLGPRTKVTSYSQGCAAVPPHQSPPHFPALSKIGEILQVAWQCTLYTSLDQRPRTARATSKVLLYRCVVCLGAPQGEPTKNNFSLEKLCFVKT